ncbi:hypothetical protein RR46_12945 [Papilio xuthus]|uniref:Uncharacterized protein n=1 Tax=Papilio xuthus TaxID=66420 RepID=A0A194PRL8_PAPXU|nr:hypothetical protein RR46_12945 [Papilio xuthus]
MGTLLMLFFWTSINCVASELRSTVGRKHDLRYGFHKVADCASFEQSFLCIQKCVDLNYDVAHADKDCKCTCFIKKDREKYKSVSAATRTRWRSGAPKTSIPPWAGGQHVVQKETVPEINILDSSEEDLKSNSTNNSNGEDTLKDTVTGGDDSNSTAATDTGTSVANGDVSTNGDSEVTADTSLSTAAVEGASAAEEQATEAPAE